MRSYLLLFTTILCFSLSGQFTLLDDIADGATSGLGFTLNAADKTTDGFLYFQGATNQFNYTIYRTDGTTAGTSNAVTTEKINYSSGIFFGPKDIYIIDSDGGKKLKISDGTNAGTKSIEYFNDKSYGIPYFMGDKAYLLSENSLDVFVTDGTEIGSMLVGSLPATSFNIETSSNDSLAVFYDKGNNLVFDAQIIHNNGTEMSSLVEFFAPIQAFENVRFPTLQDQLLFFQGVENGSGTNYVYNTNTKVITPFDFVGSAIAAKTVNGKIITFNLFGVLAVNPETLESEEIANKAFAFTTYTIANDKIYFIGDVGNGFQYIESDGTLAGTKGLANTSVSTSAFNPRQTVMDGKLYYLNITGASQPQELISYNLSTDERIVEAEASEGTGGIVLAAGLFTVNDKLVLSRFTSEFGHEMYVLGSGVDVEENELLDISLKGNVVNTYLEYQSDKSIADLHIYNASGVQILDRFQSQDNKVIDVSSLSAGQYYVQFIVGNEYKTLAFVKM